MEIMYTMHSLASMLQVSTRTLRREIEAGKLRSIRVRGSVRIKKADVHDYLTKCTASEEECVSAGKDETPLNLFVSAKL